MKAAMALPTSTSPVVTGCRSGQGDRDLVQPVLQVREVLGMDRMAMHSIRPDSDFDCIINRRPGRPMPM